MVGTNSNLAGVNNSDDALQVTKAADTSEQLRDFMKDPSIPRGPKQEALDAVLGKIGVSDLTQNFFGKSIASASYSPKAPLNLLLTISPLQMRTIHRHTQSFIHVKLY